MKVNKVVKYVAFGIASLLLIVALLPFIFKGKIEKVVKETLNEQVNAHVAYGQTSISLFRNFPNLSFDLKNFVVTGKYPFEGDTLIFASKASLSMVLSKVIFSGQIEIPRIEIENPLINILTDSLGRVNYLIVPESTDEKPVAEQNTASDFKITLNQFKISNGTMNYFDDSSKIYFSTHHISVDLKGDFSAKTTNLEIASNFPSNFLRMDSTSYLENLGAGFKGIIECDFEKSLYTFKDNSLSVNGFIFNLLGNLKLNDQSMDFNWEISSPASDMKALLTMFPAKLSKEYMLDKVDAKGTLTLNAKINGSYKDENHLPGIDFTMKLEKGYLKYSDLPESVNNIEIDTRITLPNDSNINALKIDVNNISASIASNPINSSWHFSDIITDMFIYGNLKTKIDFATLKNAIHLDSMDINGLIQAELAMKGRISALEQAKYQDFYASGQLTLKNFMFTNNLYPKGIHIPKGDMTFDPAKIKLSDTKIEIGTSDFLLNGFLENYILFALNKGVLKGQLNHVSDQMNIADLMPQPTTTEENTTTDSAAVLIPQNLNINFSSKINKLIDDSLTISNIIGNIGVTKNEVVLKQLSMNLLDGSIAVSGLYNTKDSNNIFTKLDLMVQNIDLVKTVVAFPSIQKIIPITRKASGRLSTQLNYYGKMDRYSNPKLNSILSNGTITSTGLTVQSDATISKFVKYLKKSSNSDDLATGPLNVKFKIEDGKFSIEPFDFKIGDRFVNFSGYHTLENQMNYVLKTQVESSELGKDVSGFISNITGGSTPVPIAITIKGNIKKPEVGIDASQAAKEIGKAAKEKLLKGLFGK